MDENQARWPIKELARRVAAALSVGYAGPGSARVQSVPDVRAIRWYATIGLLDKPAGYRGRVALYGPHHLRQLVAVKRRQADGVALADIQVELAGATPKALERLARVPRELLDDSGEPETAERSGARPTPDAAPSCDPASRSGAAAGERPPREANFWTRPPVRVTVDGHGPSEAPFDEAPSDNAPQLSVQVCYGLRLAAGLTVMVESPHQPTDDDLAAVRAAAQPLLRALEARGLLDTATNTGVSP